MRKSAVFLVLATLPFALAAVAGHTAARSHHDEVALADMHDHMLRHYGNARPELHTFGVAAHWSHDWELRWIDYHRVGGRVRVYHLTHKHDPQRRYTLDSHADHLHSHSWQPVH